MYVLSKPNSAHAYLLQLPLAIRKCHPETQEAKQRFPTLSSVEGVLKA